jgi:hypothetical protein
MGSRRVPFDTLVKRRKDGDFQDLYVGQSIRGALHDFEAEYRSRQHKLDADIVPTTATRL